MKHLLLTTIAAMLLVGCGPSPNELINEAVFDGNIEAVKQHLGAGTDVNARDANGMTPLHNAAVYGHNEIAELLIAKGAGVNANVNGDTPLHNAAWGGNKEIIELLIANGANVKAKGGWGGTPLHVAANRGHKEVVELLLAKGADVNAKVASGLNQGKTPLDGANETYHPETADLLRKHGGKMGEEAKAIADTADSDTTATWLPPSATSSNAKKTMGEWLKESMQEQLNRRHSQLPASTIFDIMIKPKVLEVTVVRGGLFSNTHKGIAKVQYKRNVYNVVVTITTDGEHTIWEAPPGSFLFLAQ